VPKELDYQEKCRKLHRIMRLLRTGTAGLKAQKFASAGLVLAEEIQQESSRFNDPVGKRNLAQYIRELKKHQNSS